MSNKAFDAFCNQIGTEKQHNYACHLASKAGYSALRYAVHDAIGISVSKCNSKTFNIKEASKIIDYLKNC